MKDDQQRSHFEKHENKTMMSIGSLTHNDIRFISSKKCQKRDVPKYSLLNDHSITMVVT